MKSSVTRKSYRLEGGKIPRSIMQCLAELGLEYHKPHRVRYPKQPSGFWLRKENELHFLLHDAWRAYRKRIKLAHPDKPGGSEKECARLNRIFHRVKWLFAKKGIKL